MNDIQKTIFATLWDYKQAGILDPNTYNDEYLLSQLLRLSTIQKEKIIIDQKDKEYFFKGQGKKLDVPYRNHISTIYDFCD